MNINNFSLFVAIWEIISCCLLSQTFCVPEEYCISVVDRLGKLDQHSRTVGMCGILEMLECSLCGSRVSGMRCVGF